MQARRICLFLVFLAGSAEANDTTYYVSSSAGMDTNDGLSPSTAFATVGRVNQLALGAGDHVLFRCGDTWRVQPLVIVRSGAAGNPIVFGSNPQGCGNKPVLLGSQPIAGWTQYSGGIWVADLGAGANAGLFPKGINQLFRAGRRLPYGRWPNITDPDGGYSTIDGYSTAHITDNELPAGNWTGAAIHMKGIRWYILNRDVTGSSGKTLTLNQDVYCYTNNNCTGWGYFINGHLKTLDQEGEWYHDPATNRVYLGLGGRPARGLRGRGLAPAAGRGRLSRRGDSRPPPAAADRERHGAELCHPQLVRQRHHDADEPGAGRKRERHDPRQRD